MSKFLNKFLLTNFLLLSVLSFGNLSINAQETIENLNPVEEIVVTGSRIKGINTDSFANDFDPSYRTWGSQFWYARVSSRF
ncbi:MAG: hypothetical protein CBD28_001700 [Rhizobiales bacterium TMED168]|nr:MAG: hypothetical protein CBD28_001700 [Rhizobiales bacterium TMED168]